MKLPLDTVTVPEDDFVHIRASPEQRGRGNHTLCGWTDIRRIAIGDLSATNCPTCLDIFNYCNKGSIKAKERRTR